MVQNKTVRYTINIFETNEDPLNHYRHLFNKEIAIQEITVSVMIQESSFYN